MSELIDIDTALDSTLPASQLTDEQRGERARIIAGYEERRQREQDSTTRGER